MPDEILPIFKFCKKCDSDTERFNCGVCKACSKARGIAWRAANPEKLKAQGAAWREANPERHKAKNAAWFKNNPEKAKAFGVAWRAENAEKNKAKNAAWNKANPDKLREYSKKWAKENPEKVKEQYAKWRANNEEYVKERLKVWQQNNPDTVKIYNQNRRALKIANGGTLSKGLEKKLFKLQKGKCACCGHSLGDDYHLDHIMPLSLGGANTDDNMQLLRSLCNLQKHAKHPIDFMQERGFLL